MNSTVSFILEQAGRYPLLAPAEEIMLGKQVQQWIELRDIEDPDMPIGSFTGDGSKEQKRIIRAGRKAYNRMYVCNIRLVINLAAKFQRRTKSLEFEDLIQEGCVGLSRAVEKFDPERGYKFSTYAYWWIRQSISRAIATSDRTIRLPVDAGDVLRKMSTFISEQHEATGRVPSIKDCAEYCMITELRLKLIMRHAGGVYSLDAKAKHKSEEASSLIDLIPCDRGNPWEVVEQEELIEQLDDLLKKLSSPQRTVISSHWGLNGSTPMQLADMARERQEKKDRTRYLKDQAMYKLRWHAGIAA